MRKLRQLEDRGSLLIAVLTRDGWDTREIQTDDGRYCCVAEQQGFHVVGEGAERAEAQTLALGLAVELENEGLLEASSACCAANR